MCVSGLEGLLPGQGRNVLARKASEPEGGSVRCVLQRGQPGFFREEQPGGVVEKHGLASNSTSSSDQLCDLGYGVHPLGAWHPHL